MVALQCQCASTRTRPGPDRFDEYFAKERMEMYRSANQWSIDEANRIERNKTDEVDQMLMEVFKKKCERSVPNIHASLLPEDWNEFCGVWRDNIVFSKISMSG